MYRTLYIMALTLSYHTCISFAVSYQQIYRSLLNCTPTNLLELKRYVTERGKFIAVLKHQNGEQFLVRQQPEESFSECICVAREALGALIAQKANIKANRIAIIPAQYAFPGKHRLQSPASLHSFVPGIEARNVSPDIFPANGSMRQMIKPIVPENQRGMNRTILTTMSLHPDLCKMAALDTFTGNIDRHNGNFFFDPETNHFFAIDLECAFKVDLGSYANNFIQSLLDSHIPLSTSELTALTIYRDTLKQCITTHTPSDLYKQFTLYIVEAHGTAPLSPKEIARITPYRDSINTNYASCTRLVKLLDSLLKRAML